jgi:hypothetical protein
MEINIVKESKDTAISKIDQIAEKYSSLEILRVPIQLIPFGIGSAIDSLFGNRASEIQYARLKELLDGVKSTVDKLDESKINKSFLDSDDFYFLCRNTFMKVANSRALEKIHLFRNIFVNALTQEFPMMSFIEICSDIVDQLNETDVQLLKIIKENNYLDKNKGYRGFVILENGIVKLANGEDDKSIAEFNLPMPSIVQSSSYKLRSIGLIDGLTQLTALGNDFMAFVMEIEVSRIG